MFCHTLNFHTVNLYHSRYTSTALNLCISSQELLTPVPLHFAYFLLRSTTSWKGDWSHFTLNFNAKQYFNHRVLNHTLDLSLKILSIHSKTQLFWYINSVSYFWNPHTKYRGQSALARSLRIFLHHKVDLVSLSLTQALFFCNKRHRWLWHRCTFIQLRF